LQRIWVWILLTSQVIDFILRAVDTLDMSNTSVINSVGALLQYWRQARRLSQYALALEAEISPRHVCFLETGRAKPSREMLLHLATVLRVPLRERNALLLSAGFAPVYQEPELQSPALAPVRAALDAMLEKQEPFPAVVMNRQWDILRANRAAARFFDFLLGPRGGAANVLRLMFDPKGLRPFVLNWEESAEALIQRVHREAVGAIPDANTAQILSEILRYPGVPKRWQRPNLEAISLPVLPLVFQREERVFRFFSMVTTVGTPQDVTSQELRVESFFPLDDETKQNISTLPASLS
jgi:transcriptional regulator with XRE-family HTH domain